MHCWNAVSGSVSPRCLEMIHGFVTEKLILLTEPASSEGQGHSRVLLKFGALVQKLKAED